RGCPKFLPCCEAGFRGCEARPRRSAPLQASACLRCSLLRRASRSRLQPLATGINLGQPLACSNASGRLIETLRARTLRASGVARGGLVRPTLLLTVVQVSQIAVGE